MRNLTAALSSAESNPSPLIGWCNKVFEYVNVGYVSSLGKLQIACFDENGKCRLCIRYQIDIGNDRWFYEVVSGREYKQIEMD